MVKISSPSFKCLEKVEDMEVDNKLVESGKLTFSMTANGILTMTETIVLSLDMFKYHIKICYRYAALEEPSTSTGAKKKKKKLELLKKNTEYKEVIDKKNHPDHSDFYSTNNPAKLQDGFEKCNEIREKSRTLYFSERRMKERHSYELQKCKRIDRLCTEERKLISSPKQNTIMFIGDRGHDIGSRIKGHLKYGGHWKEKKHRLYTSCENTDCVASKSKKALRSRDQLPSLAISLAGLSKLLFNATFPVFDHIVSQNNTALFNKNSMSLFTIDDSSARLNSMS
ncbi:hypothetical protein K501DRAFT_177409 [Backusella circina FSU 941]|nr:hypothetical protein K501DRAFT_177409 [Backusella circina FSU 941]